MGISMPMKDVLVDEHIAACSKGSIAPPPEVVFAPFAQFQYSV